MRWVRQTDVNTSMLWREEHFVDFHYMHTENRQKEKGTWGRLMEGMEGFWDLLLPSFWEASVASACHHQHLHFCLPLKPCFLTTLPSVSSHCSPYTFLLFALPACLCHRLACHLLPAWPSVPILFLLPPAHLFLPPSRPLAILVCLLPPLPCSPPCSPLPLPGCACAVLCSVRMCIVDEPYLINSFLTTSLKKKMAV